jgi:BED zinc finger
MSVVHANDDNTTDVNDGVNDEVDEQEEDVVEASGVGGELVLVPKKNSTAVIWNFFGFETSDDQAVKDPTCKHCQRKVKANGGNTSNLISHLQNRHAGEFQRFREMKNKSDLGTSKASKGILLLYRMQCAII